MIHDIIDHYYPNGHPAKELLILHSTMVKKKALQIAEMHPELGADKSLLSDGAMLHDIGIVATYAPDINCFGKHPYIMHGVLGREMIEKTELKHLALFAERHTGVGLSLKEIVSANLPLPHRDMLPQSIEEKIICFADLFFSKSKNVKTEKSIEEIRKGLEKFNDEQLHRFNEWCNLFL